MAPPEEQQKNVVGLDVVKRPLQSSRNAGKSSHLVPHEGCVATTSDGEKYLIEKGVAPDGLSELCRIGEDQGSRIVKIDSELPQDFRLVKKVEVKRQDVTLQDLLEKSGMDYNWLCNNCWNSTQSMQKEVSGELGLPWQMKAGIGAVIVAVIAMVLLVLGRLYRRGPKTQQRRRPTEIKRIMGDQKMQT